MKKFIATGSFQGQISIVYDENDVLGELKFMEAKLAPKQIRWLKENIPEQFEPTTFQKMVKISKLTFVEEKFEVTFDQFWERYDVKHNRKRCENTLWPRLSKVDRVRAYIGIFAYERHLQRLGWKSKAHADSYLSKRYWETDWSKINS